MKNAHSLTHHPDNYYFVPLEESYVALAKTFTFQPKDPNDPTKLKKSRASVHCMALLLAIMEHWNDSKRGKGRSLWVRMSYQQFADAMYGLFGRCAIQDSLEVLIGEKLISRRSYRYEDNNQYEYLFNYQRVNERLAALPPRNQEDMVPTGDYQENEEEGLSSNEIRGSSNEIRGSSNEIRGSSNETLHRFNKDTNKDTTEREAATTSAPSTSPAPLPDSSLSSSTSFSSDESSSEKKESSPLTMPPSEAPWNKETCLRLFDARRGKSITDQKRLRAAHGSAANLATNYTRQQVEQVIEQMNADTYWIGLGGADIEQVARNIDRELNKLKPKQGSASTPISISSSPSPTPVNSAALLDKLRKQQQAATAQKGSQYVTQ